LQQTTAAASVNPITFALSALTFNRAPSDEVDRRGSTIGMIVVGLPNGGMVNLRPMEDAVSSFGRHQFPICGWNFSLDQNNYDHPYWPPPHESSLPQLMRTIILQRARLTLLTAVPTLSAGVNRGIWKANQTVCKVPNHCGNNNAAKNFPGVLHDLEI
jgi:hypothetical protein